LENVTDILKLLSPRTLQVLVPLNKNEEQKNKSSSTEKYILTKKTCEKYYYFNEETKIRSEDK